MPPFKPRPRFPFTMSLEEKRAACEHSWQKVRQEGAPPKILVCCTYRDCRKSEWLTPAEWALAQAEGREGPSAYSFPPS